VAWYLLRYIVGGSSVTEASALLARAMRHDLSKYGRAEAVAFVDWYLLPAPRETSSGYAAVLVGLDRQAALHWSRNRHHPEHHPRGYHGMSDVDRIEMVADWAAAARRLGPPETIGRWIADRAERYGYASEEAARLREIAVRIGAILQFCDICRPFPSGSKCIFCSWR
jgi:hypothetical protein